MPRDSGAAGVVEDVEDLDPSVQDYNETDEDYNDVFDATSNGSRPIAEYPMSYLVQMMACNINIVSPLYKNPVNPDPQSSDLKTAHKESLFSNFRTSLNDLALLFSLLCHQCIIQGSNSRYLLVQISPLFSAIKQFSLNQLIFQSYVTVEVDQLAEFLGMELVECCSVFLKLLTSSRNVAFFYALVGRKFWDYSYLEAGESVM
ncbi:hypothetical protein TSAR_016678 [Trichomalopsis sarcophagae]|uniref:Uncharacterized protein n=1 Tax=Trichomalopsis sarcophagae TaxID=543379 RepID=A0A232FJ10_9HYME|nr:hypothetical protein TSAR_016678 [Trichomalopsis sarcophagae]